MVWLSQTVTPSLRCNAPTASRSSFVDTHPSQSTSHFRNSWITRGRLFASAA